MIQDKKYLKGILMCSTAPKREVLIRK